MGPNQTKAFAEQTEREPTEWEKILANDATHKGLIFKIYKQLIQFNDNKNQKTQLKNGQNI